MMLPFSICAVLAFAWLGPYGRQAGVSASADTGTDFTNRGEAEFYYVSGVGSANLLALLAMEHLSKPTSDWQVQDQPAPLDPISQDQAAGFYGSGSGVVQVMEDGAVLMLVRLEQHVDAEIPTYHLYDLVAQDPADTLLLPALCEGRFEVSYDPQETILSVRSETCGTFHISVADVPQQPAVSWDEATGEVYLANASQIAVSRIDHDQLVSMTGWIMESDGAPLEVLELMAGVIAGSGVAGSCDDCSAGGPGSSSCSVAGCAGQPSSCQVACHTPKWACCKCTEVGNASCKCCSESPS